MLEQAITRQIKDYESEAQIKGGESALAWWKQNETSFRYLAPLARHMLSVPGSSAEPDRAFSQASNSVNAKRRRLLGTKGKKVMFCHENIARGVL